jgi:small subunit ribosomal protein S2
MMTQRKVDFAELVKAGVHFGHQTSRWCPKMAPYIWGYKNNVHLIDVSKTAAQLEKAAKFLEGVAAEGKSILWVGTKRPAQAIVQALATKLGMPFVNHRWVGGTLSNRPQVRKSVTKLLHFEDVLSKSEQFPLYTKKEFNTITKAAGRLEKNVGGIRNLHWPLGALVVVDVTKERSAIKEAQSEGIPVVALVDTNGDPSMVNYVIPSNDDAPRAIKVVLDFLSEAIERGKETAKAQGKEKIISNDDLEAVVDEQVALVLAQAEEEIKAADATKSKGKTSGEDAPKKKAYKKAN